MTRDEQDALLGRMHRELREAHKELQCEREKAKTMARNLESVITVLSGELAVTHCEITAGGDLRIGVEVGSSLIEKYDYPRIEDVGETLARIVELAKVKTERAKSIENLSC